jgi:hypothetical protein
MDLQQIIEMLAEMKIMQQKMDANQKETEHINVDQEKMTARLEAKIDAINV